jgi:hypothetical protein
MVINNREWVKKMYTHTAKYYSAKKKNNIILLAGKWVEMEIIMLSKGKPDSDEYCVFSLKCGILN